MSKQRPILLDLLVQKYPEFTRERLYAFVVCGSVFVNAEKVRDPRRTVPLLAEISIVDLASKSQTRSILEVPPLPYVSRGGTKLEGMLTEWNLDINGKVVLDAGSSTGGFTHCLLLRGAKHVHAVDVGYNQLDYRLRQLTQISVHERCNILSLPVLDPVPDFAVADLSFRSLVKPARAMVEICTSGTVYGLVKPQFERRYLHSTDDENFENDFSGIVDKTEHLGILLNVGQRLAELELCVVRVSPSCLPGTAGNTEYFFEIRSGNGSDNQDLIRARLFSS